MEQREKKKKTKEGNIQKGRFRLKKKKERTQIRRMEGGNECKERKKKDKTEGKESMEKGKMKKNRQNY